MTRTSWTLCRLAFRLSTVLLVSAAWPPDSIPPAHAASALCATMAAMCMLFATGRKETFDGDLNHWHEAGVLTGLALLFAVVF